MSFKRIYDNGKKRRTEAAKLRRRAERAGSPEEAARLRRAAREADVGARNGCVEKSW